MAASGPVRACQEFVKSVFGPPVLVIATEDAEAICQKNEVSLVELLRPFSQTESTKSESFHLRFWSIADLVRPSAKASNRFTSQHVKETAISIDSLASDKSESRSGEIL